MQRNLVKLYLGNTSWLFAERALQLTLAFAVNVYVARYLNPARFGLFNYALSVIALASPLATLGIDAILVRELVRRSDDHRKWLGTAFTLKLMSSILLVFMVGGFQLLFGRNPVLNGMMMLIALGLVLQSMNVIDDYFQSQVAVRYSAQAKMAMLIFSSIVKIVLIICKASILPFAALVLLENCFFATALWINYNKKGLPAFIGQFDIKVAKRLMHDSWPMLLTSIAVAVYLKIDQIMLKRMLDAAAVGQYAAAVRISEALYFIPFALTSSFFPAIIAAKEYGQSIYLERLQRFYDLMVWLGVVSAVLVAFILPHFVPLLYGDVYKPASAVLRWHGWSLLFVFMANASSRWFLIENRQKSFLIINTAAAVSNIFLNLWLIPMMGISGAAISTVIAYAIAGFVASGLLPSAWPNFRMLCKSLNIYVAVKRNIKSFRMD